MVEKMSKASVNVAVAGNIDSSADSSGLLKAIEKKKKQKQGDENALAAGMVSQSTLARLNNLALQGSGGLKTEKRAVKQSVSTFSWSSGDSLESGKDDSVRRKVALAVAVQAASGQKDVVAKTASRQEPGAGQKARSGAASGVRINAADNLQLSQNQAVPVASAMTANLSAAVTDKEQQDLMQRIKDDAGEIRPALSGERQSTVILPQQGETTAQSKNASATLTQLKTQASAEATSAKQGSEIPMLEVDYPFQRWSGDHSVKVSVPADVRRDGSVTLLPSDARAAEALLRNIGDLTSLTPELLQPQQERDEQQHQQQQQQQDEEQE